MRGLPFAVLLLALLPGAVPAASAPPACPPEGYPPALLSFIQSQGFMVEDARERQGLALALLACTGHPNPALRDNLAYGAIATWLRGGMLDATTVRAVRDDLLAQLRDRRDPQGFRRSFAALLLSEVAQADHVAPLFDAAERRAMVDAAVDWLTEVRDYRGFVTGEGWRHGVAHGADLALHLVMNDRVEVADVERLLAAVGAQVAPTATVFYVQGEPERLARVVLRAHRREILDAGWWDRWIDRIAAPSPLPSWRAAFGSEPGLARRHNVRAFLLALAHLARRGGEPGDAALLAACDRALDRIDGA